MTKLYELPRTKTGTNIYGFQNTKGEDIVIKFYHIDGAYSYCEVDGQSCHLSASTPLEKYKDGYKLIEEAD